MREPHKHDQYLLEINHSKGIGRVSNRKWDCKQQMPFRSWFELNPPQSTLPYFNFPSPQNSLLMGPKLGILTHLFLDLDRVGDRLLLLWPREERCRSGDMLRLCLLPCRLSRSLDLSLCLLGLRDRDLLDSWSFREWSLLRDGGRSSVACLGSLLGLVSRNSASVLSLPCNLSISASRSFLRFTSSSF